VPNKINDLTTSVATGRSSATVAPTSSTDTGAAASPAAAPGEVHITDTATRLAALEQSLRDSPAVDSARVDQLRSAIEQGRYTVEPVQVANQLVQMERVLDVLGSKSSAGSAADSPAVPSATE
jgi:negative regulator of flagellin synthesis FlgM